MSQSLWKKMICICFLGAFKQTQGCSLCICSLSAGLVLEETFLGWYFWVCHVSPAQWQWWMPNRREINAGDFGQCQPFLHCVKLNKQDQGKGNGNCLSGDELGIRAALLNLNAENFHRLCPALAKRSVYLPKMQHLSWGAAVNLGEGEKPNQTSHGGRRTYGSGSWCWSIQMGEEIPAGLWLLERKGHPGTSPGNLPWGHPPFCWAELAGVRSGWVHWLRSWNSL